MRYAAAVWTIAALMTLPAVGEMISEYDHRSDTDSTGHYVLFVSRALDEGSAAGYAFAVLGRGEAPAKVEIDQAFGLIVSEGEPVVGKVPAEVVEDVRFTKVLPETRTLVVRVDKAQYEKAAKMMGDWAEKESFEDEPDVTALNFVENLLYTLGMKRPFRPVLSRANPQVYFEDITKMNRNP